MIERYSLTASHQQLTERFGVDVADFYQPVFNAAPTQLLPVITLHAPQGLSFFYWGESPVWAKNKTLSERIINTHVEKLLDKPVLKKALIRDRCLIPSDGFYVGKKVGKKLQVPYRVTMLPAETLFSMPALWEEYENDQGQMIHTFSMITQPASAPVQMVSDRMPVLFSAEQENIWLDKTATEETLVTLLQEPAYEKLNIYTVSPRIFDVTANHASLILPAPAADQFGNLTLFD
jgi:putative SOS response-associated peptidase YedK